MLSTDNTSLNAQLNASERARLDELETAIDRGLQTFSEVGKASEEIRKQKLYAQLERLPEENRQLKAELRQRDIDWERRLAYKREKIRTELKAEYEEIINSLTAQVKELTRQLDEIRLQIKA